MRQMPSAKTTYDSFSVKAPPGPGFPLLVTALHGDRIGHGGRHCGRSSTSRTLRARTAGLKGFWRNAVPGSSTP
jgi:hypothetical protein